MPVYDYICADCGPFEGRRPMSESAEPGLCPECRASAPRVISAPRLNLMSAHNRYAETRNEKSAHEPDVVHSLAPGVGTIGHGHGHVHTAACRHHAPNSQAGKRPWMLGH